MREQRLGLEWILICQRSLRLKWGCTKDPCCHPFLAVVVDVVTEFAREGALSELLYADDLFLMSDAIEGLRNKFLKWMEIESKDLKINLGKTMVMVSGRITMDGISKSMVDPCGVCSLGVKDNSVVCLQCGKWIHGRCAGVKRVAPLKM